MALRSSGILLAFYGDDNTGSTDAMEALAKSGINTVLFLSPPTARQLERHPDAQAIGIAGMTRSMPPDELATELEAGLNSLASLNPRICHYKVCSTFDSSPSVGSIGRAIDVGASVFDAKTVPLVVGVPALQRFTVFGHLFAAAGSDIYRIDRHPTMSRHPVTPMDESDLRIHLAKQTPRRIALMDVNDMSGCSAEVDARWDALCANGGQVVLLDVVDRSHLAAAGRLIWRSTQSGPLFVCGSSGVEYAVAIECRRLGLIPDPPPQIPFAEPVDQTLTVSGSCSPVTAGQIKHVLEDLPHGRRHVGIDLRVTDLLVPERASRVRAEVVRKTQALLAEGRSVVLFSARGPDDSRIVQRAVAHGQPNPDRAGQGGAIGSALGEILRQVLDRLNSQDWRLPRVIIAGGDTSGHVARRVGIEALTMCAATTPGAPLCSVHSSDPKIDGLEVVFKGGQVGDKTFLERISSGQF